MKALILSALFIVGPILLFTGTAQSHGKMALKNGGPKFDSTYVTPQKNPEHFQRYNASRACGQGHNAMSKQHRQSHQYRRAHTHSYVPWHAGCDK